jgi:spore coat polysaccharide biosynthesis predicted glycosyltransferase SpsG
VIASAAAHLAELRKIVERLPYECHLHIDEEGVAELMADSDVAISGGGMTSYELACLGVRTLVIPASPVEAQVAEALAQHSEVSVIRGPLDDPEAVIAMQFRALLSGLDVLDPRRGPSVHIDGQGLERVVAAMSSKNDRGA